MLQNLLCRYRAHRDRFKLEVLDAFIKLSSRDQQLLCKAFDVSYDEDGLNKFFSLSRKELAEHCDRYYVRLSGNWEVLHAFHRVLHSIRIGR